MKIVRNLFPFLYLLVFTKNGFGLVLWCLTPLSAIFQLYRGSQFYWWRKPEYPEKTTIQHVNIRIYFYMYKIHALHFGEEAVMFMITK
jgi:hypothetical protein